MIYDVCFVVVKIFFKIFFPYRVYGLENINLLSNGFILCSNHVSNLDPFLIVISTKMKVHFLAKSELFESRILSCILSKFGAIPIKRGKQDTNALKIAENVINSRKILGIFIEGTRSKTGNFLRPRSGTVLISMNTNSPILPVCITPSNGKRIRIFTKTKVVIGKPILNLEPKDDSYENIRKSTELVMNKIKSLR